MMPANPVVVQTSSNLRRRQLLIIWIRSQTLSCYRLQYMNRNGTESLVGNITVNASGVNPSTPANYQAAVRYFQLGKSSPTAPYTVAEQATFSPDAGNGATGLNRWMASAAMDVQGDLAIGYTISGT